MSRQMEAKGRVSRRSQAGLEHHFVAKWMDLQQGEERGEWGRGESLG